MGGTCGSGPGSAPGAADKCRAGKSSSICICHSDIYLMCVIASAREKCAGVLSANSAAGFCRPYVKTSIPAFRHGKGSVRCRTRVQERSIAFQLSLWNCSNSNSRWSVVAKPALPLPVAFEVRLVAEPLIPKQWARGPRTAPGKRRAANLKLQRLTARPEGSALCPQSPVSSLHSLQVPVLTEEDAPMTSAAASSAPVAPAVRLLRLAACMPLPNFPTASAQTP